MNGLLQRTLTSLRQLRLKPEKRKGQHFAIDETLLQSIVKASYISTEDVVLEIGGGLGTLSEQILAEKPRRFIVVEKDPRLAEFLRRKFSGPSNVQIMAGDYLRIGPLEYDKCVSNPPFNISSKIVLKLIHERPSIAVLTFQEQFAKRLLARAGTRHYGRLSVIAQLIFHVEELAIFSKTSFYPAPKTGVSALTFRPIEPKLEDSEIRHLEDLTRELFKYRRKKFGKALRLARLDSLFKGSDLGQKLLETRVFQIEPGDLNRLAKQMPYLLSETHHH